MTLLSIFVLLATARHAALAATCDELGWTNAERFGDPKVCGESNKNLGGCSGKINWADANLFCESAGARLCTLGELLNDEPRGTGCLYNWVQVWSSTACTSDGSPGFWRAFGNSREGSETVCTQDTANSEVRCCADVDAPLPTAVPTPAPSNSPTERPSFAPSLHPSDHPTSDPWHLPSLPPTSLLNLFPTTIPTLLPPTSTDDGLLESTPVLNLPEDVPGAPFVVVPDCEMTHDASHSKCTLDFGAVRYSNPTLVFTTRGFQQTDVLTGPVIRVRAGDIFQIQMNNGLSDDDNTPAGADINIQHLPNTTNIHTHGLHISGEGTGDNVFTSIYPGESLTYTYDVPSNHMGGTFWYHPHHHGSSALQAGGGACGMLIVEDEPGSLPDVVKSMEEVILVMQYIEPRVVARLQAVFNKDLWSGGGDPILLTNGQTAPVKAIQPGVWYRFRMLFTSIGSMAIIDALTDSGTATCEFQLLAKDGIYLNTAPRFITKAYLTAGGRADVMVRCSGSGDVILNAALGTDVKAQGTFVAMRLAVSGVEVARTEIAPFSVYRPCYLVDTRTTVPSTALSLVLGSDNPNTKLNGVHFSSRDISLNPTEPFITGTLGEVLIEQGTFVHSLHIHVNPYQFSTISPIVDEIYFQEGDWHDTFNAFTNQVAGPDLVKSVVRFWVDKYAGHAVIHCHQFQHEDDGMMNTYSITGGEGVSVDAVAKQIDPLCYSDLTGRGFS